MATLSKVNANTVKPLKGDGQFYVITNEVDLAAVATGDVVEALAIAAGTLVLNVTTKIITACGLTATATVGDGAGAAAWNASVNLNAAANTLDAGVGENGATTGDAYVNTGKLYSAADTIDLTCTITAGPIVTGKIKVTAICVDLTKI